MGGILEESRTSDGMTLGEVARELPGLVGVTGETRVFGVQHDSRRVMEGDLFAVRRGEKHDGRAFVDQAVRSGARALLVDQELETTLPTIRVKEMPEAFAYAAAAVYGHPAFSLDVIGITGTNGKTTTTHLVRTAIDGAYGKALTGIVGTVGHAFGGQTIEASHTTPEADELARILAVMRKRGATNVAMEVSSIAVVMKRVAAVRFRVAAFTNLTQDHLDFHGSMEAYAAAKMELFTKLGPGLAVVNIDDPFGPKIVAASKCGTLRVSAKDPKSDVFAESVETNPEGMNLVIRVPTGKVTLKTRLVGAHNVENLLVTLGIVAALELDVQRAADALALEGGAPGRLERCDGPGDDVTVLVDYAHTPDALARVLDAVRGAARKRLICVFGCGGDRDPTKRGPMGEAVATKADLAVITSDNPRTEDPAKIVEPIEAAVAKHKAKGTGYVVELDRKAAIEQAIRSAAPGDLILIAGKGHEDYQIIGTEKRPFDDRTEAKRALAMRRG